MMPKGKQKGDTNLFICQIISWTILIFVSQCGTMVMDYRSLLYAAVTYLSLDFVFRTYFY